ncbi:MAG: leucine-rich repeat domain-containing protein, partial [Legionella sp.]|nr:leucine-rich repeat domain-containing protein [Legionella sp.]
MHLSADGRTLIEVTNDDLHEGQLIIPNGVKTIGQFAFEKCTNLTALTIPEGVIVSEWGHIACPGLTEVSLAKGVWLGRGAFPGRTSLIKVNISEGVYIDRVTFVSCTRLKKVSIAAGTSVGWHAFEDCTALTELSLAEGVWLNRWAFWGCTALTRIIVNTEQDQELTRIKNLFPQHQHAQFMKKSVYDLMCLQDKAYHQLMREPWVSGLFPLYEHLNLIPDILPHINAQEGTDHLAYRLFHEEVAQLTFPTEEGALAAYQQQLQDIVQKVKQDIKAQIIEVQKAQCIAKLQGYVRTVEGLMQHKLTQHSGFFAAKPALHSQLTEHTAAVGRLIQYVQGDKTVQFSQEAIHRFSQGFVGQTLAQF